MDESTIQKCLLRVGITPNLIGFNYITSALMLIDENEDYLHSITKMLYPSVAELFDSTPDRVERGMRHAIKLAHTKSNVTYSKVFKSFEGEKPTNSKFLGVMKLYVRECFIEYNRR